MSPNAANTSHSGDLDPLSSYAKKGIRAVLFGPPGAGKGTQSARMRDYFQVKIMKGQKNTWSNLHLERKEITR